jgi:uncharacterized NAD-dependent epimerase/dehydratase family protein
MNGNFEGNGIVYCQGAFGTTNGKTAHGLVRRSHRYRIMAVIDSVHAGKDAGEVLGGPPCGIPVASGLKQAIEHAQAAGRPASHFIIGQTPDGGRLGPDARERIADAIASGLSVVNGSHDFFSEDPRFASLAKKHGVNIKDVRKPPPVKDLHFFDGRIGQVDCLKVAVLGTDSAVGKRTTAVILLDALNSSGHRATLVGTGQTSWMQGVRHCIIMDSLVNDFVAGEIEHAVWRAWSEERPEVILVEGQGSLMNPAYPGGFEILAAARPDIVILQHPPARKEYDGFPGFALHDLGTQIRAVELLSGKPVVAITVSHEGIPEIKIEQVCSDLERSSGLPCTDVLMEGAGRLTHVLLQHLGRRSVAGKETEEPASRGAGQGAGDPDERVEDTR